MRDYDSDYGYADSVNRRARWGVVLVAILVFGIAYATNASSGRDGPPVSVLSLGVTGSAPGTLVVGTTTTSAAPAAETATVPTIDELNPTPLPATTTTEPPAPTTSTTRPRTTTTRPATTTTTTTIPPTTTTTTIPPTTTTTTTTIPPIVGAIHLHDLKGEARGGGDEPYARIEVHVRNDRGRNQRGVLVVGRFSAGEPREVSGTTSNKGKVVFESGIVDTDAVTFTVINLVLEGFAYTPEENQVGPAVTVEFD